MVEIHRHEGRRFFYDSDDPWDELLLLGRTLGPRSRATRPNNDLRPAAPSANDGIGGYHRLTETTTSRCWCDEHEVTVTWRQVAHGQTESCGLWDCTEAWDARAARWRARERRTGKRPKRR